jgi:hypothetical protein
MNSTKFLRKAKPNKIAKKIMIAIRNPFFIRIEMNKKIFSNKKHYLTTASFKIWVRDHTQRQSFQSTY